jgi:hypothetical protein
LSVVRLYYPGQGDEKVIVESGHNDPQEKNPEKHNEQNNTQKRNSQIG